MSKTELEEDLRATFERAAASVPLAPDLASRATTGVRRAQRRTWLAAGAAAAAVAVIAGVAFSLNGSSAPVAGSPSAVATTRAATTPVTTMQTLAGSWRPVRLDGFTALEVARPEDPILTFNSDGTWTGSDGCNGLQGTFSIGQRGEFTARVGGQRLVGCNNVPHTAILQAAKQIVSNQTTLRFFAGDGLEVARYARAR